jgi:hypothetical protein
VLKKALCRWKEYTWPIEVAHSLHPNNCPNQQHLGATAPANQRPVLTRNTVSHGTTELSGRANGDHWSDSASLAVVETGGRNDSQQARQVLEPTASIRKRDGMKRDFKQLDPHGCLVVTRDGLGSKLCQDSEHPVTRRPGCVCTAAMMNHGGGVAGCGATSEKACGGSGPGVRILRHVGKRHSHGSFPQCR